MRMTCEVCGREYKCKYDSRYDVHRIPRHVVEGRRCDGSGTVGT